MWAISGAPKASLPSDFKTLILDRSVYEDEEEGIYEEYFSEDVAVVSGRVVKIPRSRLPKGTYYIKINGVRGVLDVGDDSDGYWFRTFRIEEGEVVAVAKFYYTSSAVFLYTISSTASLEFEETGRSRRVYYVDGGKRLYLGALRKTRCYTYGIVRYTPYGKESLFKDWICGNN